MLHNLSIGELADRLADKQISSVELARHFLARIERLANDLAEPRLRQAATELAQGILLSVHSTSCVKRWRLDSKRKVLP